MNNPYQPPIQDQGHPQGPMDAQGVKSRHGCVTAYLIFMIIANAGSALVTLTTSELITDTMPDMPSWGIPALVVLGVLNVVFAVLLFRWKRIGFYGFIVTSIIAAGINMTAGLDMTQVIGGLIGVGILFGVLQIGKPASAWSLME